MRQSFLAYSLSFICACGTFGVGVDAAFADDSGASSENVYVRVRAMKASQNVEAIPEQQRTCADSDFSIDAELNDIRAKLKKLHFRTFKLLSSQEELVPVMKKTSLFLSDRSVVTVRPLYVQDGKVGIWLRWQDSAGMKILDTRMHFRPKETMITGMDGSADSGTVLAVEVKPQVLPTALRR